MIGGSVDIGIDSYVDVDLGTGTAEDTDIDKDVEVMFPKENDHVPSLPFLLPRMWM